MKIYLTIHSDRDTGGSYPKVYLDKQEAKKAYAELWSRLYDVSQSSLYVIEDGEIKRLHTGYAEDERYWQHATDEDDSWVEDDDGYWIMVMRPEAQEQFDQMFEEN